MGEFKALTKDEILGYLSILNEKLKQENLTGEIALFGGAVMCIQYNARPSTKDIDAVFSPKTDIYTVAKEVASEYNLSSDWLNDAVKGYVSKRNEIKLYLKFSNLNVYTPVPEYMLAMKCMASRIEEETDVKDIKFLIKYLNIEDVNVALKIVERYFPAKLILPKTRYLLEELFDN
ncbi:MAG: DUF6036 family nucleotidyltransferase [Clostridiales bacterium]|nr:DUF6036 family nucleotidyltransferase [Clostridiales bacterium]